MDNKIIEVFIPGPAGRLEAKYSKSKKNTSPIALILQPHPQYGGTMNNKVVVDTFHTFMDNEFSVCRVNFRGVGKSDGEFDNGQGDKNEKSYAFGCGEIAINLFISGLLIKSCIAINDPKEKPDTQHCELSKFSLSNQSKAAAASASSP